ncbi:hypothetical protein Ancab_008293 [Ancistrocladus abbreviatus]
MSRKFRLQGMQRCVGEHVLGVSLKRQKRGSSLLFRITASIRVWEREKQQEEEEKMIEVVLNDRLGKKVRVKCNEDDTIGDLKKLVAAQTGTRPEKIRIQKWYTIYKDHITLKDYEIHDGMGLELYYN